MSKYFAHALILSSILVSSACSQKPASVALKGDADYGRGNANYRSNTYVSQPTPPVSDVTEFGDPAPRVTSSDLPPPSKKPQTTNVVSKPMPFAQSKPPASKVESAKVHNYSDAKAVDDESAATQSKPAKLDKVLSQKTETPVVHSGDFIWPVNSNKVISAYGIKSGGKVNDGINIAAAEGEPVFAAADGDVSYVGNALQGYGNMILIKHAGNKTTTYAHLSRTGVDKDDHVKQGDIIGYVGSTGSAKTPQLHFSIHDGKSAVNPLKYLSDKAAAD